MALPRPLVAAGDHGLTIGGGGEHAVSGIVAGDGVNLVLVGGGRVALDVGARARLAGGGQLIHGGGDVLRGGGGQAVHGGEERRGGQAVHGGGDALHGVQALHGDGEALRGGEEELRGGQAARGGEGALRGGQAVRHRGDPLRGGLPVHGAAHLVRGREERRMEEKIYGMVRPVSACLIFAIVSLLSACVTLAPTKPYRVACLVLLLVFLCYAPTSLLVMFAWYNGSCWQKDWAALVFLSYFAWFFTGVGLFTTCQWVRCPWEVPAVVCPLLVFAVLNFWGRTVSYPRALSRSVRCCREEPVVPAQPPIVPPPAGVVPAQPPIVPPPAGARQPPPPAGAAHPPAPSPAGSEFGHDEEEQVLEELHAGAGEAHGNVDRELAEQEGGGHVH
ncbi:hypothetical protein ACP70R_036713 [Stipagrostis hirtigluma subsp. patula]